MTNFKELIERLSQAEVEFIIVGGFAAAIHGSSRSTQDLDVVYRQTPENIERLIRALSPLSPFPRGAVAGIPFHWDRRTIEFGANFTLATKLGYIDILGDITGGGTYGQLLPHTVRISIFGLDCLCLDLPKLIQVERATGRPKDFEAVAELEAIFDERSRMP